MGKWASYLIISASSKAKTPSLNPGGPSDLARRSQSPRDALSEVSARTAGLLLSFNLRPEAQPRRPNWPQHVQDLNVHMAQSTRVRTERAAVQHWNEGGWDTRWSNTTWGRMTHTYWSCFRCHWCWMSLPLQANKKETPIQNTPLTGHTWHNTHAPGARH